MLSDRIGAFYRLCSGKSGRREQVLGQRKNQEGGEGVGRESHGKVSLNYSSCQVITCISFEWSGKTLKCLQVTSSKVQVQGWGSGAGKRIILKRGGATKRWREKQKPHP